MSLAIIENHKRDRAMKCSTAFLRFGEIRASLPEGSVQGSHSYLMSHSHFDPYRGIEHQYGYGWHIYHLITDAHSYKIYGAGGNGGQWVLVIPDLDMVIGFTGGAYGEVQKWYVWQTQLVPEYIIRSALPSKN